MLKNKQLGRRSFGVSVILLISLFPAQILTTKADSGLSPNWTNTSYGGFWVSVTPDGQRVFVSGTNTIAALGRMGNFLWMYQYPWDEWPYIVVSDDGTYLFAAGHRLFRAFSLTGTILWSYDPQHQNPGGMMDPFAWWLPRISADGNVIAAISLNGLVKVLDRNGNLIWEKTVSAGALPPSLAISADGNLIVIATGNYVYAYSKAGLLLWSYGPFVDSTVFVSMSYDASTIVVKTNRLDIFCFNSGGSLRWHRLPYPPNWYMITSADFWFEIVDVSPDNSRIFTTKSASAYCCFDNEGNELWTSDVSSDRATLLRSSANGMTFGTAEWNEVRLLDSEGHQLASNGGFDKAFSFGISKDGTVAVGSGFKAHMPFNVCWFPSVVWVSGTYLAFVDVQDSWISGPSGDQFTTSTTFTPTAEAITITASAGESFLLLASAQLWNQKQNIGSSIAIFDQTSGQRISGDMFALGATLTHRHAATAIAVVTPGSGSFTYQLRFKTDPGGTASVSGTYLLAVKFTEAPSASGPNGDQSTGSTTFTPTSESLIFPATGGEKLFLIGSAQLWNSNPNVGSSIAICRDGERVSGDMFGVGATSGHRNIATVVAIDNPSSGQRTYTLNFKTDPGGQAWVSGTYLTAVKVSPALSSGPGNDQSSTSRIFASTGKELEVSDSGKHLLIATGQLWGNDPSVGQSLCITKNGARISGDMFTIGTWVGHRHLTTAIAVDSPGTGSFTYAASYKTD